MSVPTVFFVGIDQLEQIPDYLDLGAVVVVAPDPRTLRRWQREHDGFDLPEVERTKTDDVVVDLDARRISFRGLPIDLSDMEFRVVSSLLVEPRRAMSFRELRCLGWGETPELPFDIYSVRSLIQRLRAKLRAVGAPVTIVAVRGYGFRAERIVDLSNPALGGRGLASHPLSANASAPWNRR